eukprot:2182371-Pleurochrysis_carterae.AAC.1
MEISTLPQMWPDFAGNGTRPKKIHSDPRIPTLPSAYNHRQTTNWNPTNHFPSLMCPRLTFHLHTLSSSRQAALAPSPAVQGGAKKAARLKASVATLTSARVDADRNVVALSANRTRAIAALDPFLKSLSAAARHKLKHANAAKANADDPRNDAWPSLKEVPSGPLPTAS